MSNRNKSVRAKAGAFAYPSETFVTFSYLPALCVILLSDVPSPIRAFSAESRSVSLGTGSQRFYWFAHNVLVTERMKSLTRDANKSRPPGDLLFSHPLQSISGRSPHIRGNGSRFRVRPWLRTRSAFYRLRMSSVQGILRFGFVPRLNGFNDLVGCENSLNRLLDLPGGRVWVCLGRFFPRLALGIRFELCERPYLALRCRNDTQGCQISGYLRGIN
jgi:hypothetical protein